MRRLSFICLVVLLTVGTVPSQVRSIHDFLLKEIEHSTGTTPLVRWNESGTLATFLEGTLSLPSTRPPSEIATQFLRRYASLFGIEDADHELTITKEYHDEYSKRHVRFQQHFRGVEVWGSELIVHINQDGSIYAVNGRTYVTPRLSVSPTLDSANALARLRALFTPEHVVTALNRCIYARGDSPRLTWKAKITRSPDEDWLVFLDATAGEVLLRFNQTPYDGPVVGSGIGTDLRSKPLQVYQQGARYRMIDVTRSMFGGNGTVGSEQRGNIITKDYPRQSIVESQSATFSDPSAVDAHYYAGEFYKFLETRLGRSSWDGAGGSIVSNVHYGYNYNNAFWSRSLKQLFFGDGDLSTFLPWSGAKDIVAHEIAHGITHATSNLIYLDQSGALNESFSDIMAVAFDSLNWTIAEDITVETPYYTRSFLDPHTGYTLFPVPPFGNQPAHMSEYAYATFDNGGVHVNSGIHNKVMYHLSQSIGRLNAARVFYRAFTVYLTANAQFVDARNAAVRSARDLNLDTAAVAVAYELVGILPVTQDASELLQYDPGDPNVTNFATLPMVSSTSASEKFSLRFTPSTSPVHLMQLVFIYDAQQQGRQVVISFHQDSLGYPGRELGSIVYTIPTNFAYPALVDISQLGLTVDSDFHVVLHSPSSSGFRFYYDATYSTGRSLRFDGLRWSPLDGTLGIRVSVRYQKNATTGVRWAKQTTNTSADLRALAMLSVDEGWAVGTGGTILRTTTGGLLWNPVPTNFGGNLNSLSFVDKQHGWIVGDISDIWFTNNGGSTWQSVPNPTINNLKAVQFVSLNLGWAVGRFGTILRYDGSTWTQQSTPTGNHLLGIAFVDPQNGWVVGENATILHTNDGGRTWQLQISPVNETFHAVKFANTSTGWIVGSNGVILKTTDGGRSWNQQFSPTINTLRSLSVLNDSTAYAVGFSGTLLTCTDGSTWRLESTGLRTNYWAVQIIDENNAWIAGEGGMMLNARSGLSATVGAPAKLAILTQPSNTIVGSVITPPVRVAIQDAGGNVVPTASSTVTIALRDNPTGAILNGTSTVTAVNGVATFSSLSVDRVGTGYTLIASSPGLTSATTLAFTVTAADTGIVLSYDSGSPIAGLYEPLPNNGWVIANRLTAPSSQTKILSLSYYITRDNGTGNGSFVPVVYANRTIGVGPALTPMYEGSIYTPRSGWNNIDVSSANLSLSGASSKEFYVGIKYNGTAEPMIGYTSTSNGRAWEYDPTRLEWTAFDAFQPPFPATLFIRATVSTVTSITQIQNWIPTEFELSQNYPNPFNPSTTMSFAIPKEVAVTLKVYNIQGQEIATLVQSTLAPGTYTVQWNGQTDTGVPAASGVYFCRLQAGTTHLSKKMVLLR